MENILKEINAGIDKGLQETVSQLIKIERSIDGEFEARFKKAIVNVSP
jgi:hypothetical protein